MAGESVDPWTAAQSQIIQRAEQDPTFRSHLLSDPKLALSQMFGVAIPDQVTIRVVEDTDDTVHLVLPQSDPASGPVSDQELAQVGGGGSTYGKCWTDAKICN